MLYKEQPLGVISLSSTPYVNHWKDRPMKSINPGENFFLQRIMDSFCLNWSTAGIDPIHTLHLLAVEMKGFSEESKMLWMKFQKHYHWAYLYSFNLHMAPNASEYRICTWDQKSPTCNHSIILKNESIFEKGGRDSKGKKSWSLKNKK